MRGIARLVAVASLIAVPIARARAQVTAASLLSKMENFSVYPIFPLQLNSESHAGFGIGYEISFDAGSLRREMTLDEKRAYCTREQYRHRLSMANCLLATSKRPDTTLTLTTVNRNSAREVDSTFSVNIDPAAFTKEWIGFGVGIASQTTNIRKTDIIPGWSLTGRVEEFPSLSFYVTFLNPKDDGFAPYLGIRVLQGSLKNIRIAQGDSAATVEANGNGGGGILGLTYSKRVFVLFGEMSHTWLRFTTDTWKVPLDPPLQRSALPGHLALTGFRFSLGAQIALSELAK